MSAYIKTLESCGRDIMNTSLYGDDLFSQLVSGITFARFTFIKWLEIDPNDKHALDGKGKALSGQGNYTQAIQLFDKGLAIDPKDKVALNGKGNVLEGNGDVLYYQGNYTQAIPGYNL